ncbi:MAG: hypothetical protein H5T63_04560, partial [Chloroflexi bacterium]|nr:hypothetical protein [Chloroflexota bacterium]
IQVDLDLLREFERGLDPRHPERSRMPARVLGYGEISTVFAIEVEGMRGLAFKRLPIFRTEEEMAKYQATYEEYNRLLEEEIGLALPPHGYAAFLSDTGRPIFYIVQKEMPAFSVGNRAIHLLPRQDTLLLVRRVLQELCKVWEFNHRQDRWQVAIDGQISNWAIDGFDPEQPRLVEQARLYYMDTSTPLFRVQGKEQLNPELFLRSAPFFLAWLLRSLFLEDVVNRYYDFHRVAVDLVANFYKEQRPDLISDAVVVVNEVFSKDAPHLGVPLITEAEVRSYYREDAFIWSFYLSARKVDRFLRTRILRQEYPYILPEKIQR